MTPCAKYSDALSVLLICSCCQVATSLLGNNSKTKAGSRTVSFAPSFESIPSLLPVSQAAVSPTAACWLLSNGSCKRQGWAIILRGHQICPRLQGSIIPPKLLLTAARLACPRKRDFPLSSQATHPRTWPAMPLAAFTRRALFSKPCLALA